MALIDHLESGPGISGAGTAVGDAARRLKCEAATLEAILEVESGGDAFDGHGRLIILTEKHIFWRYLPKSLRARARSLGLATPKWSRANYKGLGGSGSDSRWRRLRAMVSLHRTAGYKSASYGAPQIMGFNHKICGYGTVTDFVHAMAGSEETQIEAFIRFLEGVGLAADIRERDFRAIARRYNGPGQVTRYAGMMERAYQRVKGRAPTIRSKKRERMLRVGSEGYKVRALQERLVALGYHTTVDGDFGPATRRQVIAFQVDHGITADGIVGPQTEDTLENAIPKQEQPGDTRQDMTVDDLRKKGSETIKESDRTSLIGWLLSLLGISTTALEEGGLLEALPVIRHAVDELRSVFGPVLSFVSSKPAVILIVAGAAIVFIAWRIKKRRLFDAINWRHVG